MPKYTPEQIEEKLQKLPPALRDALFGPATAEKIFEVADRNNLTIEQASILGEEVGYMILGLTTALDFPKALQSALTVDETVAINLAKELNQEIFIPLRGSLKDTPTPQAPTFKSTEPIRPTQIPVTATPVQIPKPQPELVIRPDLKSSAPVQSPKVVLPEKEIQIPLPTNQTPPRPTAPSVPPAPTTKVLEPIKILEPEKKPEPIRPIAAVPPQVKNPPIDLRNQTKSETIMTAPTTLPRPVITPPAPTTPPTPATPKNLPVKNMPDKGTDVYREPIED